MTVELDLPVHGETGWDTKLNAALTALETAINELPGGGGEGTVVTINGVTPDGEGEVTLSIDQINEGTTYKRLPAASLTKLNAIEPGAEVNNISDTDATDLTDGGASTLHYHASDRALANATGTLPQSQVTDLEADLDLKANLTDLDDKADLIAGKLDPSQLPDIAVVDFLGSPANQVGMLALTGQKGDWAIRTDLGTVWVVTGTDTTQLSSWTQMGYPTAPVTQVAGRTGNVVIATTDISGSTSLGRTMMALADAAAGRTALGLGTAAVAALLDEDDMASNSATGVPSQQSVKVYVDTLRSDIGDDITAALAQTTWEIYYTGSSWPARSASVPAGFGGKARYNSIGFPSAASPTDQVDRDQWWGTV